MIQLPVYDKKGKQVETLQIDEATLGSEVRPDLLKQAYVMFHANRSQGSARTKGKSGVEGSTRKLYAQKHTGNARRGQVRTNLMRGGGVAFAKTKTHEEHRQRMPKKMRRLANRNALLAKLVDNEVKCFVDLDFEAPMTKALRGLLDTVGVNRTCLIALDPANRNAALSARNLADVDTLRVMQLNVFELLNHRFLVVDKASLQVFLDGSAAASGERPDPREREPQRTPARRTRAPATPRTEDR